MSEVEEDDASGPRAIDAMKALSRAGTDDLGAYFDSVGATKDCPFCGNAKWHVITPSDNGVIRLETREFEPTGHMSATKTSAAPVVGLLCTNCGFLRQHAALHVGFGLLAAGEKGK